MSTSCVDDTLFFSKQLAFAKFDSQPVKTHLCPAFKEFYREYLEMY